MPNPPIHRPDSQPAAEPGQSANGILARIPGPSIAAGAAQLPPAGPAEPETRAVVLDVPDMGAVRIRYRLNSYKHGKSRHWHWLAVFAEVVAQ